MRRLVLKYYFVIVLLSIIILTIDNMIVGYSLIIGLLYNPYLLNRCGNQYSIIIGSLFNILIIVISIKFCIAITTCFVVPIIFLFLTYSIWSRY